MLTTFFAGCGDFFTSGNSIASLTISPGSYLAATGQKINFTATGTTVNGASQDVTSSATWSSSNTGVATIASGGVATAVSTGLTTISAKDGDGSSTASLIISASTLSSISISPTSPSVALTTGSQQFTATGTFANGSTQNLSSVVQWTSSNTAVATINSNGLATLVSGAGATTTITATVTTSSGAVTANTTMTVN